MYVFCMYVNVICKRMNSVEAYHTRSARWRSVPDYEGGGDVPDSGTPQQSHHGNGVAEQADYHIDGDQEGSERH